MILDSGIAEIQKKINVAPPGGKPVYEYQTCAVGYYAELNFETAPARPTAERVEVRTDARIRVLQNRSVSNRDRVLLRSGENERAYEITRAYHGVDDESGELITDLSLEAVSP